MKLKERWQQKLPVRHDLPAHTQGVEEGNATGHYEQSPGHLPDGRSTAERSTGISPHAADPILPEMPNLSPP
jgi:hypothetical protein